MVKQKLEQYGSQPFHLGDAFIGAGAVLFGIMIVIFFNHDPETSKSTLSHKIESLENRIEFLQDQNLDRIRDIGDVDLQVLKLNNNLKDLKSDISKYDNQLKAEANRDQFFSMIDKLLEQGRNVDK
jgi:hypothetical protein